MIDFTCDRCERTLEVPDEKAGSKFECPDCGDMNIVPSSDIAPTASGPDSHQADALSRMGLPPDSGPEKRVLRASPSIFRGSPFRCVGLAILPVAAPLGLYFLLGQLGTAGQSTYTWWAFAIVAALSWGWLGVWWVFTVLGRSFEITNKRTIERRGIVRRDTSEVLHDHVRNIQISQSVINRILNVGSIGISSSGQDGIEILMKDLPKPGKLKEVIDAYRPL